MNVAVISKASRAKTELLDPHWLRFAERGVTLWAGDPQVSTPPWEPDAIISMGVTLMQETEAAVRQFPNSRLYCYNWDVYEWVWTRPRAEETPGTPGFLDYRHYGELLRLATEVWTPSDCTTRRTLQWYPWVKNVHRILSSCPWWEHDNVRDDGYALMCLREIPDPWWGVFERCCEELGIPYKSTKHEQSEASYRDAIAGCRFICAPLYELSTGGLSLMEAYYHGKPVLLSDSPWNGGHDYFRNAANYFRHGDEFSFKSWLKAMWAIPYTGQFKDVYRSYITSNFSSDRMADDMIARIQA